MFEFELENVSRAVLHDFLHAHPFYNTSQQSQRYVRLVEPRFTVPPFKQTEIRRLFERGVQESWNVYTELTDLLADELAGQRQLEQLGMAGKRKMQREIQERAMEAARYALCVAFHASLIYTIDGVTLWRLVRLQNLTWEAAHIVQQMVSQVQAIDPWFFEQLNRYPVPKSEDLPERQVIHVAPDDAEFQREFDGGLAGLKSRLVDYTPNAEGMIAQAVRVVLRLPGSRLSDDAALELALNPAKNPYFLDPLNLTMAAPLAKALGHAQYSFQKKLSHVADSQNQRHRTIPSSRAVSILMNPMTPDYVMPALIARTREARERFEAWMREVWQIRNACREAGALAEYANYLLPQGTAIRMIETGALMHLWYKFVNRSCLRAEEEIWLTTMQEIEQIRAVHPRIGEKLGPPCFVRKLAHQGQELEEELGKVRYCNQGRLYCRQPVWSFYPSLTIENSLLV